MDRPAIAHRAARLARIPIRIGAWLVRNARDHPHTIGYQDASAAALWPLVREEEDVPPRWKLSED